MNVLNNEILFKQNSKCSVSTVHLIGVGNPHMENCSKYSGSMAHTCEKWSMDIVNITVLTLFMNTTTMLSPASIAMREPST